MPFQFDNTYARLPDAFYAPTSPTPVAAPVLIQANHDLAAELGIDPRQLESPHALEVLSGNRVPEGATPIAMAYSGHQFGGFSPQLGDGRAVLLGEIVDSQGRRQDVQLKGAGPTPFSRRGDGRSALGPVIREYLVSEAMAALGVPTTRALAAVATGEQVVREGRMAGGVFTRVAASHVRVGTFQWFYARKDVASLRVLADYVIERHYPEARESAQPYRALLDGVIERQAKLIAHWMQLGFIHGVMNTDNMTVSGETIDYGPCAFMDTFHPLQRFSSIDHQGRYAFASQSSIGHWNLMRFAETLLPLLHDDEPTAIAAAEAALEAYPTLHQAELQERFAAKIGRRASDDAWKQVESLLTIMANGKADFTLVFRRLPGALSLKQQSAVTGLFEQPDEIEDWLQQWRNCPELADQGEACRRMRQVNPVFIPRNHRVEEVIQAGYQQDYEPFARLLQVLQNPWTEQPANEEYEAAPRPEEVVHATFCGT